MFILASRAFLSNAWVKSGYVTDIIKCDRAIEILEHILLNNLVIDVIDIADKIFNSREDKELKYNFIENMENKNLSNFNIDKKIATKMLKNRILKTNTGIKISAKLEDIRNNLNFIIKENGNGSYDLVVKNVEFAEVN